jgi:hypothetical protein
VLLRLELRLGVASERLETAPPPRACFTKPVVEDARERRRDHLRADGDAAEFVVGLVTVRDVAV